MLRHAPHALVGPANDSEAGSVRTRRRGVSFYEAARPAP
jgi:hypothetical protein